jgi:transposase InsO family protein
LQVAPSAYRRYVAGQKQPERRCARAKRDDVLLTQIERVWHLNMQVYGAQKVWRQLKREGIAVARCTVERLMHKQGLAGVRRGKVPVGRSNSPTLGHFKFPHLAERLAA